MKPDFMIIGAQKCATSTIYAILDEHPQTKSCRLKEPHFFSTSPDWKKGLKSYEDLYDFEEGKKHFEGSTSYTFYPLRNLNIWDDLYEYNRDLKFIYMVRDPESRILSSYIHMYERGYTDLPLLDALRNDPFFFDVTRYATQIKPFIERFGREQILILEFEDFNKEREKNIRKVSEFLSLDFEGFKNYENAHTNETSKWTRVHKKWDNPNLFLRVIRKLTPALWKAITNNTKRTIYDKTQLNEEARKLIWNMLGSEVKELEGIMQRDLSHWRKKASN